MAVLGAGTMAPGIALAFAEAGARVLLWARSVERADRALDRAETMAAFLQREGMGDDGDDVMARISVASFDELAACRVVVEVVAEHLETKRQVFGRLEEVVAPDALLATNTSGLRVSDIARDLTIPERVLAMHFWNPAHLMPIVEIGGGARTSQAILAWARDLATSIGKLPVVLAREVLGFLGTRMQQAVVREAIALLDAGVASAEDIDLAVRASFGIRFPVIGPLESADLSGLDVIEAIHGYLLPDLDRSTEPQAGLRTLVARGDLGVKTGRGFHDWSSRDAEAVVRRRDEEILSRVRQLAASGDIVDRVRHEGTG